ncbi:S8 family serine peptidase [Spirosoma aerophilum]
MATNDPKNDSPNGSSASRVSSSVDELLLAALDRGDDHFQTGRFLVTFREGTGKEGLSLLGLKSDRRVADARDFSGQAVTLDQVGDADAVFFPELNIALIGGHVLQEHPLPVNRRFGVKDPIASIDPEYFVFADGGTSGRIVDSRFVELAPDTTFESLPGFADSLQRISEDDLQEYMQATETIARDVRGSGNGHSHLEIDEDTAVASATWGLKSCRVLTSTSRGAGVTVALLTNGFDLGHPDFAGRPVTGETFVGQPVLDLNGHGTHMVGTACGPQAPNDPTPRYGISYGSSIFVGKVLTNSMAGTVASVLTGINWGIANRCPVICAPVAMSGGPSSVFTTAGQAALNRGCLIIAGSGSSGSAVGAPANSPTILSVAALNPNLQPTSFSPVGKVDIAAPGQDTFSSWTRPRRYNTISGIASATAHVAGCAALWAETSPTLRGMQLWRKLLDTARGLPFPPTRVGAGLVQAP